MEITVRAVGGGFDDVIRDTVRDLRRANRIVGRRVATVGRKAITARAPRMFGRKLTVKTTVKPRGDGCEIGFAGRPSGAWAIADKGARPHLIRPRRARALRMEGGFAMSANHPGTSGHKAWVHAGDRLRKAIKPVIEDVYGDALGG